MYDQIREDTLFIILYTVGRALQPQHHRLCHRFRADDGARRGDGIKEQLINNGHNKIRLSSLHERQHQPYYGKGLQKCTVESPRGEVCIPYAAVVKKVKEHEDIDIPPFLISSISTTCNLHCKGCYARSNGIAEDSEAERKATITPEQWKQIFTEAADMGINFSLLAGGEPMMRKDILEAVAEVKDMIFPIFTNGTLIGPSYLEFLRKHLNMVPIISIEGTAMGTDERRGQGVFRRAMQSMELLKQEDLFFGTSITVTTENYRMVTSSEFIDQLRSYGCKIVFFIEYVPTEEGT